MPMIHHHHLMAFGQPGQDLQQAFQEKQEADFVEHQWHLKNAPERADGLILCRTEVRRLGRKVINLVENGWTQNALEAVIQECGADPAEGDTASILEALQQFEKTSIRLHSERIRQLQTVQEKIQDVLKN